MYKIEYILYVGGSVCYLEEILEKFDIMEFITDDCLIYGGAVRDVVAGKPLIGDLDVAVNSPEFATNISRSSKWVTTSNHIPNRSYNVFNDLIHSVISFRSHLSRVVQVIMVQQPSSQMDIVRNVDISCCGVAIVDLSTDDRLVEIVENALDDCRRGVLRINKQSTFITELTLDRANKLVKRGWKKHHSFVQDFHYMMEKCKKIRATSKRRPTSKRRRPVRMPARAGELIPTSDSFTVKVPADTTAHTYTSADTFTTTDYKIYKVGSVRSTDPE